MQRCEKAFKILSIGLLNLLNIELCKVFVFFCGWSLYKKKDKPKN